jgi:hypothetical protein
MGGPSHSSDAAIAYGAVLLVVVVVVVELADIGAVAEALAALLDALIALLVVVVEFENDIVLLESVAFASLVATFAGLQAATETAATAAPTIRIVRIVPEVMSLVPSE